MNMDYLYSCVQNIQRERGKGGGWRERDEERGGSQARQVFRTQQTKAIK